MDKRKKCGFRLLAAGLCCLAVSIPLLLFTTGILPLLVLGSSVLLNAAAVNLIFFRKGAPLSEPREDARGEK